MKERERKRAKTITADTFDEFDKLYNSTADELAGYDLVISEISPLAVRFYYTITETTSENLADDFMQNNVRCTCSDCPFLQIGTDARRKWFPCAYSKTGETRLDTPACEQFYNEAVAMMRKAAGREATK